MEVELAIPDPIVNILPIDKNEKYTYEKKGDVTLIYVSSTKTMYTISVKNTSQYHYSVKIITDGNNVVTNYRCKPGKTINISHHFIDCANAVHDGVCGVPNASDSYINLARGIADGAELVKPPAALVKPPAALVNPPAALVKPNASNIYTNLTGAAGNIYTNLTGAAGNIYTNLTSATHAACGSVEAGNLTSAAGADNITGSIKIIIRPCKIINQTAKDLPINSNNCYTTYSDCSNGKFRNNIYTRI